MNEYLDKLIDDILPDNRVIGMLLSLEDSDNSFDTKDLQEHYSNVSEWIDTFTKGAKAKSLAERSKSMLKCLPAVTSIGYDRKIFLASELMDRELKDIIHELGTSFEEEDVCRLYNLVSDTTEFESESEVINEEQIQTILDNRTDILNEIARLKDFVLKDLDNLIENRPLSLQKIGYSIKFLFALYAESIIIIEDIVKKDS